MSRAEHRWGVFTIGRDRPSQSRGAIVSPKKMNLLTAKDKIQTTLRNLCWIGLKTRKHFRNLLT